MSQPTVEHTRLAEDHRRDKNWKRWGPYLSERQWGTVREDYSQDGNVWHSFTHDDARSRAYRWGEDGLLGWTDRECRLCFALALWNGKDPILKERLFGLAGPEGNHGEDVKELYYYVDSLPTHCYAKAIYKYPLAAYPYDELVQENARRTKHDDEYELVDTGILDQGHVDVTAEYAKGQPDDTLIRITLVNHGDEPAELHVLPTLWFRNTWVWGCEHEGCTVKPWMGQHGKSEVHTDHETLGKFIWRIGSGPDRTPPELLFTDNHTNAQRLYGSENRGKWTKDAFHRHVVDGEVDAVNPDRCGTKAAAWHKLTLQPGEPVVLKLRLSHEDDPVGGDPLGNDFDKLFKKRLKECETFYDSVIPESMQDGRERAVTRQAYAGLLWTKQFYHYIVDAWLHGDPDMPPPPEAHHTGRNSDWEHLFARDVLSMPDKWEYPWFAAWDSAFHMLPLCQLDPHHTKRELVKFLREWYMHPNGQIPAYEFNFNDVNPPVHAWACWRVYKLTAPKGERDVAFLASCFQKLLLNFTWWVNRKDESGQHVFSGGFLGLDNIGVFDRSAPMPDGTHLNQADGTAWMAFYCTTMLAMALELAQHDRSYADMASKFFEHFVAIADAINTLGGSGLWDEQDGFYYDQLRVDGHGEPVRVRSLVGLMPLIAVEVLQRSQIEALPGFKKRMDWFLENRQDLARHISYMECGERGDEYYLLALPSEHRLRSVLRYMLDEDEFLCPFGIRSLSKFHERCPYRLELGGQTHEVAYAPGESRTTMFGGNSNWRGPVWLPTNYLIIEALQRYHHYYGDGFTVECPVGSGQQMNLRQVAREIERRLAKLFLDCDAGQQCPSHGGQHPEGLPGFDGLYLFHEYFHAETGRGCGAMHQTGWTSLIARCLGDLAMGKNP
jgi:hypothetical protein